MKIVLFRHPPFMNSRSMPRYANWLSDGMARRGHTVENWTPVPAFYKLPVPAAMKKWLGYLDQYVRFPRQVRKRLRYTDADTLFIFSDHALGPWVPLVADRPHVIHCHDFLAQLSALGKISENPTGWSGRQLQAMIRNGFSQGKNFISISKKTAGDLMDFLKKPPRLSVVIPNGVAPQFNQEDTNLARAWLAEHSGIGVDAGFLLHVGGNQWYKNRIGVVELYDAWRRQTDLALPLIMLGPQAPQRLLAARSAAAYSSDIHFISNPSDELVKKAYAGATVFLFPSLAEGFGWPIVEAMASGCPVITTGESPMDEVGGHAAFYIPRYQSKHPRDWARQAATTVESVISLTPQARQERIEQGLLNVARFDSEAILDRIEKLYHQVLRNESSK